MERIMRQPFAWGLGIVVVLILLLSTVSIVPETKQAVLVRLNRPVAIWNAYKPNQEFGRTGAGVRFHWPFIERVVWVDKRVLDFDMQRQEVLSTDQLRLVVDAFARFRVVDPLRMVLTAGSERRVTEALQPILGSALRNELGKRQFALLLSPERGQVMDNIQAGLNRVAKQYGVEIVDVRIKRADLPTGTPLESAYQRMRTARQQEALTIRAQGLKQAQLIRADADAEASRIYSESFNKDPDFYDFYRAMQSYEHTFGVDGTNAEGSSSIVLSPSNDYLREFRGGR
ncbi:protease modulator HflC [Sphingomonas sp. ID0503]|uniref:protease modulator HflC n=1 Tax=Sphingomonas sp. ID0503 TaxID=3399691 RepID=UPI003AFA7A88